MAESYNKILPKGIPQTLVHRDKHRRTIIVRSLNEPSFTAVYIQNGGWQHNRLAQLLTIQDVMTGPWVQYAAGQK